jgi:hypothetical protein
MGAEMIVKEPQGSYRRLIFESEVGIGFTKQTVRDLNLFVIEP